jgi:predicted metallo-beta-lactamase superfamily hydrolase
MTNPKTPAEATAAKIIQQMYDDVAIDHHLHPDDDFEQILDIVADQLDNDYGDSDAETREAVEKTSTNALEAAMLELRKLAGLR